MKIIDDLIDCAIVHEHTEELMGFGSVVFKKDFGPWKKGDKAYSLWFDLEAGRVEEYDKEITTIQTANLSFHAS